MLWFYDAHIHVDITLKGSSRPHGFPVYVFKMNIVVTLKCIVIEFYIM